MDEFRVRIVNVRRKTSAQILLGMIERFLVRHDMRPTNFGIWATGDRTLVHDLRRGRIPTMRTADKARLFMARYQPELVQHKPRRMRKLRLFTAEPHLFRH